MKLFVRRLYRGFRAFIGIPAPYNVEIVEDIPNRLLPEVLYLAEEDGDYWMAAMDCPCGCKSKIQLSLLPDDKPKWAVKISSGGPPSLHPSVWRTVGCKSHFWFKNGLVNWCKN